LNGDELIKDTVLRGLNMIDISLDKLDLTLKQTQKDFKEDHEDLVNKMANQKEEYENKIDELTKSYENKIDELN